MKNRRYYLIDGTGELLAEHYDLNVLEQEAKTINTAYRTLRMERRCYVTEGA